MKKQASFADRLKEALDIRQMTKADLARMTGISKSSLTHYEKGDWEGKQDAVYKIAKALGVTEAWLMGFDSANPVETKQPTVSDGLSEKEQMLLKAFRLLSPERQQFVIEQLQALSQLQ